MTRRLGLAACLGVALLAPAAEAAVASDRLPAWLEIAPDLGAAGGPARSAELPSQGELDEWRHEGYGYVDLLWRIEIEVRRSGETDSRIQVLRYFLSDSGIAQGGNLEFWADAARDSARLEAAYSVSPDGTRVGVDAETIEVLPDMVPNVFSDLNRVVLPIPALQPGSTATFVGIRRFQTAHFPLPWSRQTMLGSGVPVARVEIEVSVEEGAPEIVWDTDDPGLECEERAGGVRCVRLDVPPVVPDRDVESYLDLVPQFYVGFATSWRQLQQAVWRLVDGAAQPSAALRAKLAELDVDPEMPPEKRLLRLLRFVADEIRYVSLAHGDAGVVPRDASTTLSRRYGDCKDKVALLVALGRLAKLEITPVLTSTERKDPKRVLQPASGYFDHMVACLGTGPTPGPCVDPTQAYGGLSLPPQLADAIALPLSPAHEAALVQLETSPFAWEVSLTRRRVLEQDGSVVLHDVRRFAGPGAPSLRNDLLNMSSTDRRARAEEEYRQAHGTTPVPRFSFPGLRDASAPYGIDSQISIPGAFQPEAGRYIDFDRWLVYYAQSVLSVNRHHPYRLLGLRYESQESVALCCGRIAHFGPKLAFESAYGSLRRSFAQVDGELRVHTVLELPARVIPPEEVPRLESFVMQSIRESAVWITWR